jgi:hypothetical protein
MPVSATGFASTVTPLVARWLDTEQAFDARYCRAALINLKFPLLSEHLAALHVQRVNARGSRVKSPSCRQRIWNEHHE